MAERPGRENSPLKGYRRVVNKLPDPAARGSRPVPPGRFRLCEKRFTPKVVVAPRGARSDAHLANAPLAAFAFFARLDRMRAPKEERTP